MTTAFVLQGGAGLAAGQVGMLRALVEAGVRPDMVLGTSAGALNAVGFAQDPTYAGLDTLARLWVSVRRRDVLPVRPGPAWSALRGRSDGLVSSAALATWLSRGITVDQLEDTLVPVGVVATDARAGRPVVLSTGPAMPALLASAAVPGVFPSVSIGGRDLVDGGVAADLPVRQATAAGATTVYVLPRATSAPGAGRHALLGVLVRTVHQVLAQQAVDDGRSPAAGVVVLPPPVSPAVSPFDFRHAARLIDDAYAMASARLRVVASPAELGALAAAA